MITGPQCFEARTLLTWTRDRLAPRVGLNQDILRDFEIGRRDLPPETRRALQDTLEQAGAEFRADGDVQLRSDRDRDEGLRLNQLTADNDG